MTNKKKQNEDITDSPEDQEKLKPEQTIFELPELKDIPGANRSGKNADQLPGDITISSSDEEGEELLEENDGLDETNVSRLEKKLLRESFNPSYDRDLPVESLSLDDRDNEGDLLEETAQTKDLFGKDLDDELVREEDEESEGESQQ